MDDSCVQCCHPRAVRGIQRCIELRENLDDGRRATRRSIMQRGHSLMHALALSVHTSRCQGVPIQLGVERKLVAERVVVCAAAPVHHMQRGLRPHGWHPQLRTDVRSVLHSCIVLCVLQGMAYPSFAARAGPPAGRDAAAKAFTGDAVARSTFDQKYSATPFQAVQWGGGVRTMAVEGFCHCASTSTTDT